MNARAERAALCRPCGLSLRVVGGVFLLLIAGIALAAAPRLPSADEIVAYAKNGTTVDASHCDQGYVMVRQEPTDKRLKMRVSLGKNAMTYDLNATGEYEVFPLQMGNGDYRIQVFSQVKQNKYSGVSSFTFPVELENELTPFLYPNQYVNYDGESPVVAFAEELFAGLETDGEKARAVYDYIVENFTYDFELSRTVQAGYLPDPDVTLETKTGVCFDMSAFMAAVLRSQGVPAQLVIGYADRTYHAWNSVYCDGQWTLFDATSVILNAEVQNYTVERYY